MRVCLFLLSFLMMYSVVNAQSELYGLSTEWDDSFKEWIIYTDDEDVEGELELRWSTRDNWREWDYRIDEETGSIKQKWENDPSQWEVRGGTEIITMRTKWSNDFTEWRISNGSQTFTLVSKYRTQLTEWSIKEKDYGHFQMYTTYDLDTRDWDILDEMSEEISIHTKMAIVFIVMYQSTPKF